MQSIATLIVDDEPHIRMLMPLTLDTANAGLWVCGEASDGHEAVGIAGCFVNKRDIARLPDVIRAVAGA